MRSGAALWSICVPSSLELETKAFFTPAWRSTLMASGGGTTDQVSWL